MLPAVLLLHECPLRHELLGSDGLQLRDVPGPEPVQCHGLPVDQFFINLTPVLTMRSRQQLEEQGLTVECGHAYCADYWCFPCSVYQQGVYVKHVLKQDFVCCTYQAAASRRAAGVRRRERCN